MGLPIASSQSDKPTTPRASSTSGTSSIESNCTTSFRDSTAGTGAGANAGAGVTRSKTDAELEAYRLYDEAIEDEYAKREGGA